MSASGLEVGACPRFFDGCQGGYLTVPGFNDEGRVDLVCNTNNCPLQEEAATTPPMNAATTPYDVGSYKLTDLPQGSRPDLMGISFAELQSLTLGYAGYDDDGNGNGVYRYPSVRQAGRQQGQILPLGRMHPGLSPDEPYEVYELVEMDVRDRALQLESLGMNGLRTHFAQVLRGHSQNVATAQGQALTNENKRPDMGPDCE